MRGDKLKQFLATMNPEQYALTVGTKADEPLVAAFAKRRVVHAGVKGTPLAPEAWQSTWQALQNQKTKPKQRAAYIHIPFCRNRCLYCGFFQNYSHEEKEILYIDHLIKDLQMSQDRPYLQSGPINAVFIGGGTPSSLSPHNVSRLLAAIRKYLPLANDYELTLEGRINDLVPEKIEAWLAHGVNRVSIGVQSFNTEVRRAVGRLDDTQTILNRLELLSSYQQAVVIIDLIYGLPKQTTEVWAKDIELLKTAAIDGMDLYQLNIYQNSALQQAITAGKLPPAATTAEQAKMFAMAEASLSANVFSRLSNCHWGKNTRERSMYNTLTKAGYNIIPFGAGAGGNVGGVSLFLNRDTAGYMKEIEQGRKPIAAMMRQPASSELHNLVVGQLERGYISLPLLAKRYGTVIWELEPLLALWKANGLITIGADVARLTVAGQFWCMNITQSLLECLYALMDGIHSTEVEPIAAQG